MRGFFIRLEPPGVKRKPNVLTVFPNEFEAIEAFGAGNVDPFTVTAVTPFGLIGVELGHYGLEVAVTRRIDARFPRAQGGVIVDDSPVTIGFADQRLSEGDAPLPKR